MINAEGDRLLALAGDVGRDRPVLIAGATASGKSALALAVATRLGGRIVNADALQVYADWRILTARPTALDEAQAHHALYGHVPRDRPYSTGDWLRDALPLLDGPRPIVVGGTGLYFAALTEGLAAIPEIDERTRAEARRRIAEDGAAALLPEIDAGTLARIDTRNPRRVQRAWEVLTATGRGLAQWQDDTPPPALRPADTVRLLIDAPADWIDPRIALRTRRMFEAGVLDEARANRPGWSPALPSSKAIGAAELMAVLDGTLSEPDAAHGIALATRRYAKRQRTWFRNRMGGWPRIDPTGG